MAGLGYLWELRRTVRPGSEAAAFRYCRTRFPPGSFSAPETWGHVQVLYEVDESFAVVRQLQIHERARFVYRFDREHPEVRNARGQSFGGGLRSAPLSADELEEGWITHREFEHAWLTGRLGELPFEEFRDELLCDAVGEGPQLLWEAWDAAECCYPYAGAGGSLLIAERAVGTLLGLGLAQLVDVRDPAQSVSFAPSECSLLLAERRSWSAIEPYVAFGVTAQGLRDLQDRGLIRSS
jgi:hypothetical protein